VTSLTLTLPPSSRISPTPHHIPHHSPTSPQSILDLCPPVVCVSGSRRWRPF
jgi:hypothetical protein